MASHPPNARYPDATAVTYDEQNFKATVIYNDHSVYVWDVRDIKKVRIIFSFVICVGSRECCKRRVQLGNLPFLGNSPEFFPFT